LSFKCAYRGGESQYIFEQVLKKLFELKASGSEEEYIYGLQRSAAIRKMMEKVLNYSLDIK